MPRIRFSQWSGLALMLGSLLFMLNKAEQISRVFFQRRLPDLISGDDLLLVLLGQLLLAIGWLGCLKRFAPASGGLGQGALRLLLGGGIALGVGHVAFVLPVPPLSRQVAVALDFPLFLLVIVGTLGVFLGLILFGLDALRSGAMGRWGFLPLVSGLLGFGFIFLGGETLSAAALLLRTLFGFGLVGLGLVMWADPQPRVHLGPGSLAVDSPSL